MDGRAIPGWARRPWLWRGGHAEVDQCCRGVLESGGGGGGEVRPDASTACEVAALWAVMGSVGVAAVQPRSLRNMEASKYEAAGEGEERWEGGIEEAVTGEGVPGVAVIEETVMGEATVKVGCGLRCAGDGVRMRARGVQGARRREQAEAERGGTGGGMTVATAVALVLQVLPVGETAR